MAENSKIEWTATVNADGTVTPGATWNPVRGCTKISPGCKNCYAETFAERWRGIKGHPYEQGFDLRLVPEKLDEPLSWKKPRRVFVNSMSDLFHEEVPDEFIADVFAVMWEAWKHTYQVLTKRAERMASLLSNPRFPWAVGVRAYARLSPAKKEVLTQDDLIRDVMDCWPLRQCWLGVSVEDQKRADERIPHLLRTPAAVRFLSCEPLLGPVDLWKPCSLLCPQCRGVREVQNSEEGGIWIDCPCERLAGLRWVIVGGESGHGARPCDIAWIRSIVQQCKAAGTPCFVKQMGSRPAVSGARSINGELLPDGILCLRDKKGGDPAEWPSDLRVREFPQGVKV